MNVIFPDVSESAGEKYDVLPAPYCYPAASENSLSSITRFKQFFAKSVVGAPSLLPYYTSTDNPPNRVFLSGGPSEYRNFCTIAPFTQNRFLATDSSAGGKQHFYLNDASRHENVSFPHFVYSIQGVGTRVYPSSNTTISLDEARAGVSDNEMFFNNEEAAFAPWYFIHETLHWLGAVHPHRDPKLQEFLKEVAINTGDPIPSMSAYSDQIITDDKNFKNFFYIEDMHRSDSRYSYLRPYDVLFLEAKRNERMMCLPERERLGYVVNSTALNPTVGQQAAGDYMKELASHSFPTLSTSSQRILAHSFQRLFTELQIAGSERLAEGIIPRFKTDDPAQSNLRKFITSENGINAVKTLARAGANIINMGVSPAIASFMLQGTIGVGTEIGKNVCGFIATKTGFADTEIAQKFQDVAQYISDNVPREVREIMLSAAIIYAANHIQYSQYTEGFRSNFDMTYNPIPRASISPAEAAITAIVVGVIAAVIKGGAKKLFPKRRGDAQVVPTDTGPNSPFKTPPNDADVENQIQPQAGENSIPKETVRKLGEEENIPRHNFRIKPGSGYNLANSPREEGVDVVPQNKIASRPGPSGR